MGYSKCVVFVRSLTILKVCELVYMHISLIISA